MAALSYGLTRQYLLSQRQRSAQRQAQANARLIGGALRSASDVTHLLTPLQSPAGGSSGVLFHGGRWFAASLEQGRDAVPARLRDVVVVQRQRARQRYSLDHAPRLAVGLPLPDGDAYFELFALRELDRTVRTLRVALATGAGGDLETRRSSMDERTARNVDLLSRELTRFERLVQDLIEISRFDAGLARASFERVYLAELVLHAADSLPDGEVPVEVGGSASDAVVEADN